LDEHELLTRIRSRIGPGLTPVRPLAAPGARALWLLLLWILLGVGVVTWLGPRSDIGVLGASRSVGFSLLQAGACWVLGVLALRRSIPAMSGSSGVALASMALALVLHLGISWATLDRSEISPARGDEWDEGMTCVAAILALTIAPLVLGIVMLARGLLMQYWLAFALCGVASGLAAEAIWRLRCPYSTWEHVLPFHSGAVVLAVLLASGTALLVRLRHRTG